MFLILLILALLVSPVSAQTLHQGVTMVGVVAASVTTTTSAGTTTTTTPGYWQDDFERASLGGNWTQFVQTVVIDANQSDARSNGTSADSVAYWNVNSFTDNNQYACIQIGQVGTPASSVAQTAACLVVAADIDAVCCGANWNTSPTWEMYGWENNIYSSWDSNTTPSFVVGDYVGIQRTSTTAYQCFKATAAAPTTWSSIDSVQTLSNMSSNGNGGIANYIAATSNVQVIEQFEAGPGTLPTDHSCGKQPLVRTNQGEWLSSTGYGTAAYVTGSFTPPANSLLIIGIGRMENASGETMGALSDISGGGLTYTSIGNAEVYTSGGPGWRDRIDAYRAPVGGSPSSMTVSVDSGTLSIDQYYVVIVAYTNYNASTPVEGYVTSGTTDIGNGSETQTLATTPATGDASIAMNLTDCSAACSITYDTGWTTLYTIETVTDFCMSIAERTSSTSTSVVCTDTQAGAGTFYNAEMLSFIVNEN